MPAVHISYAVFCLKKKSKILYVCKPGAIWNQSSVCWETLNFYHLPQGRALVDRLYPSFFAILMEARLFSLCTVPSHREVRRPHVHVSPVSQLLSCPCFSVSFPLLFWRRSWG